MNSTIRALASRGVATLLLLGTFVRPVDAGSYQWTTAGPEPGLIFQILVNPQDSNIMLALSGYYGQMLFRTTDRGLTWTQQSLIYGQRLVQDPANANGLYTIGFDGTWYGVLKSLDGGSSWMPAGSGIPTSLSVAALAAAPSVPGMLYAIVTGNPGLVYRSLDGAASWTVVSNAFPATYVGDVAVDPNEPATVYAAASPSILKSTDGGATWVSLPGAPDGSRIVIDPRSPETIYASGNTGMSRSVDEGATWQPANGGIADHWVREIALDPANPERLYAASNGSAVSPSGGLFVTENRGQDWLPVDLGVAVNLATAVAVDPRNAALVYSAAGTSVLRGSVFASADSGGSWAVREKGLSGYYSYAISGHPSAGAVAYCVSGAKVYRTDDAGAEWALRGAAPNALTSLVLDPTGADTLYAGYSSSEGDGVFKSADGGATWNPATEGLSVSLLRRIAIAPSAPGRLLAPSLDGLFGTTDGGGQWSPLLSGDVRSAAVDSADDAILYAGLWGSLASDVGLLRSPDGGTTWDPPSGIPTSYPHVLDVVVVKTDPSRVYAALYASGGSQGVYRSLDRGLSFAPATAGLPSGFGGTRLVADPTDAQTLYVFGEPSPPAATEGAVAAPADAVVRKAFWSRDGASSWVALPGFLPAFGTLDFSIGADGRTLYASTLSGAFQFERSFLDVPAADPFWASVDSAAMNGVTSGCGSSNYCPTAPMSRSSVAVFLLRGKDGALYAPPAATGTVFGDVAAGSPAADFVEELFRRGITAGCGAGNYCPGSSLSRAEAAVLLLKTMHGSSWVPPAATGTVFADVPADAFAAAWIEELFAEGITAGCGSGNYCPDATVSRAQAAALVVRAFGLS